MDRLSSGNRAWLGAAPQVPPALATPAGARLVHHKHVAKQLVGSAEFCRGLVLALKAGNGNSRNLGAVGCFEIGRNRLRCRGASTSNAKGRASEDGGEDPKQLRVCFGRGERRRHNHLLMAGAAGILHCLCNYSVGVSVGSLGLGLRAHGGSSVSKWIAWSVCGWRKSSCHACSRKVTGCRCVSRIVARRRTLCRPPLGNLHGRDEFGFGACGMRPVSRRASRTAWDSPGVGVGDELPAKMRGCMLRLWGWFALATKLLVPRVTMAPVHVMVSGG